MYTYTAYILKWVDGDTVDLDVDLGFHIKLKERFRVLGLDTPERTDPNYTKARIRAEQLCPLGTKLTITTSKADKYGRWLVDIPHVRDALIFEGLGVAYDGGHKP